MELLKLNDNVKEILPQFKFKDCKNIFSLPFDFKVVLNNDKDIQKRDKIKYDYCKNNDINLLVIKYTDFNIIKELIDNFINQL